MHILKIQDQSKPCILKFQEVHLNDPTTGKQDLLEFLFNTTMGISPFGVVLSPPLIQSHVADK